MYVVKASDQVMHEQYADSERWVNGPGPTRIRTLSQNGATFQKVADQQKEPEPVSEFLRFLISRWEADGKKLYRLAEEAGLAKSMPSQIKAKTSDASLYSARKFAKPFGYADLPDLVNAAWTWWHSDRSEKPASAAESPRAEALRLAESYGVTRAQIDRVLAHFPLPDYGHQDALWWLARFHEERSRDAERAGAELAARRAVEAEARAVETKQAALRDGKERLEAARGRRAPSTKPPPARRDQKVG